MARRVFFSFHYDRDIWRVNQIRNIGEIVGVAAAGFHDAGSLPWRSASPASAEYADRSVYNSHRREEKGFPKNPRESHENQP